MGHSRQFVDHLTRYDRVVEIGIGRRPGLAAVLVERGVSVVATDVHERPVPEGVTFVVDDVVEPDHSIYGEADAVYARNLPPELHRPTLEVARAVDADCLFTTLGGDEPAVPVERVPLERETLYVARRRDGASETSR